MMEEGCSVWLTIRWNDGGGQFCEWKSDGRMEVRRTMLTDSRIEFEEGCTMWKSDGIVEEGCTMWK